MTRVAAAGWVCALLCVASCSSGPGKSTPITPATHSFFPITAEPHALECASCHPPEASGFDQFTCVSCHTHGPSVTNRLHLREATYAYDSKACLGCHPSGAKVTYDHFGITNQCAECHAVGTAFAALPKPNFTHPQVGTSDCGGCHVTTTWLDAGMAPNDAHDPARDVAVTGLVPTWAGPTITRVTPLQQSLPMPMNHGTLQVPAATMAVCANCHEGATEGAYYPGTLHSALANLSLPQPALCNDCHTSSLPSGFVGPMATAPARTPPSGEMRHEAVAWLNGTPGTAKLAAFDCALCHTSPNDVTAATWSSQKDGGTSADFHASLRAGGKAPVGSCIDCHANTRPTGVVTSQNIAFDHSDPSAQGDCAGCHAASAAANTSWAGGQFHAVGSPAPTTCLPCHAAERPTSTVGWTKPNFAASPFDYGTNAAGITHGAGLDCAVCHKSPTTWANGAFAHGAGTLATSTCLSCHTTQRPDLLPGLDAGTAAALVGFDHAANGTGDCFGCHQATVTAGTYVNLYNPGTGTLPNGDWKGGQQYPGSVLVSSATQKVTLNTLTLLKTGPLVTGTSSSTVTLYNAMLHTASVLPAALNAGPGTNPDYSKCWHCHTNTNGTVTAYSNGKYHSALTGYRATPAGAVVPFPQPTNDCVSCHSQMRPPAIVQKAGATASLQSMDHAAAFTGAVQIGGMSVTNVSQIECARCHKAPGTTWSDGAFHPNVAGATPADCTTCHFPLMADAPKADVTTGTTFAMRHRSPLITFQNCQNCHAGALNRATMPPLAAALFKPGAYHASLTATTQPGACLDCHAVSDPTGPTQSAETYTLTMGATATNGIQVMSHASAQVAGRDCVQCHAADAKVTPTGWAKTTRFHPVVTNPATCRDCHGTSNGGGTVIGTNNNLPAGLTSSATVTTASAATGVAGQRDQISHADLNVTAKDCNFCHTQKGSGTGGKEWAQAKFHVNFGGASPLLANGTTARCSNCHLNLKPGAGYTQHDHAAYTAASGTTDCGACHAYPGTGTIGAGNWLGATGGVPTYIPVGGFTVPVPPATTAFVQSGIANLPHPTVGAQACTACHAQAGGGKQATGYDHKSTLINANCNSCHETGSNLVGTVWNGATTMAAGAGDTRPFTINNLVPSFKGNTRSLPNNKHFFPINCYECHRAPTTGNAPVTTGAAYLTAWKFKHSEGAPMTKPATCNTCHNFGIPK